MCKTRRDAAASDPKPRPSSRSSASFPITDSGSYRRTTTSSASSSWAVSANSKASSSASLAALRDSLPETPTLYPFSEISAATNYFLSRRLASASSPSSWRCSLRGKDTIVFQRPFRGDPAALPARLAAVCKSHHSSLVRLLGVSLAGEHIYLVYEHSPGASLAECLRNPRNPNFTPLSSWMSRIQIAADLAQGLEYIHHHSGIVHNRIKSSSVLVTEPHFRAKICHIGAADLAGEVPAMTSAEDEEAAGEISPASPPSRKMRRSGSRRMKIEGSRGYMAPELLAGGNISRRSDVYALGVVLLELLSGDEPIKYRFGTEQKDLHRVSLIETARETIWAEEDSAEQERRWRVRQWMDRRLRDSYPVEAAEELIRVALRCVEADAAARPDMTWVAGKVSKIFLDSKAWEEKVRVPTDFSVSIAPR